jgi:hypothetical protein
MLIPIKLGNGILKEDSELLPLSFNELGLRENDIEELLRKNIEVLVEDESLLIVGQQVANVERGRSDLIAVDESGNTVLIEIKRDVRDIRARREPFEFQAIRYAASFATIQTPDELVDKVYAAYIERRRDEFDLRELTPGEKGRRLLGDFLKTNNSDKTFNKKQRILLVASSFDPQTLSAVAWLISNGVDISCFTLRPVRLDDRHFLQIEKLLPLPSLDTFYCEILERHVPVRFVAERDATSRANLPRMPKLFEWGLIEAGDRLSIRGRGDSESVVLNERQVSFAGSDLTYNMWGKRSTGWSAINIYEWAINHRFGKTLDQLRQEQLSELSAEA